MESIIVNTARKLDSLDSPAWQIGIQFFQVGDDQNARKSFRILDDNLKDNFNNIRDMVDTVPYWIMKKRRSQMSSLSSRFDSGYGSGSLLDGKFILKVVTDAVNRRLDR